MTARSDMDERLLEEAMAWHVALESDDADWDGYTLWLEADPRHREAFDVVALTDRLVGEHRDDLRLLTAAPPPQVRRGGRRQMLFGGVAAALALAIGIPALMPKGDTVYATGAGETRRIALRNGAAIDLAPASRLVVKEGDENDLELAGGEAYFDVRHDPARALTIHAQGYAVSDIGTRFAMNLAGPALLVSVAEGHVAVGSEGNSPTNLAAGQKLVARGDEGTMRISRIAANDDLVLDNSSTHKTPAVKKWLLAHPRFELHFTPTSSSWMNLVERWFSELTNKKLRRGAHRSVRALNADIRAWIKTWNDDPKPYVWTKTADQSLESIAAYCTRINESRH